MQESHVHAGQAADRLEPEDHASEDVNRALLELLVFVSRVSLLLYPIYVAASLGLGASWLLLLAILWTCWRARRSWKTCRLDTFMAFLQDERRVISREMENHSKPAWGLSGFQKQIYSSVEFSAFHEQFLKCEVDFTDKERADWLNKILVQAWPFLSKYMERLLKEKIQPQVRSTFPLLKTFTFTKIHFGKKPLKVTGVKAYTDETEGTKVTLDLDLSYQGDMKIEAEVKRPVTAGVNRLWLQGTLRVLVEPLIGQLPIAGGITMFFLNRPTVEVSWTGMTNLLDNLPLSHLSDCIITDTITSLMVLPNRLFFPLLERVKPEELQFPLPQGVVRILLMEAQDLIAKDIHMMGMVQGKSDPYAILRTGLSQFHSKTIQSTLDPRWNERCEFIVYEAPGQKLEVELFDEDPDKDDFLGCFQLDLGHVKKEKRIDKWFHLERVPSGRVHLELQWLSLQNDCKHLMEAKTLDGCACALLAIYLDRALNLTVVKRKSCSSLYVEFTVDKQIKQSKVTFTATEPVWEEGFHFLLHSVTNECLSVQIKEQESEYVVGTLSLPLRDLLNATDMTLDQHFQLEPIGCCSKLRMKATVRALVPEMLEVLNTRPETPLHQQTFPNTPASPQHSSSHEDSTYSDHLSTSAAVGTRNRPSRHLPHSISLISRGSINSAASKLMRTGSCSHGTLKERGGFGDIQLTVRYAAIRRRLIVTVCSCRNLFPWYDTRLDTYVRLYLLPDKSWKRRMRTRVKKSTSNPIFNETFEFDVPLEEAECRKLDVAVKSHRGIHKQGHKNIGTVLVDFGNVDLAKGFTQWFELSLPVGLK